MLSVLLRMVLDTVLKIPLESTFGQRALRKEGRKEGRKNSSVVTHVSRKRQATSEHAASINHLSMMGYLLAPLDPTL